MVLRVLVLALTLLNLAYYIATAFGGSSGTDASASRQVSPEVMRVVKATATISQPAAVVPTTARSGSGSLSAFDPASPSSSGSTPASAANTEPRAASESQLAASGPIGQACLESGPYFGKEAATTEVAMQSAMPAGGWEKVAVERPGVWMVFMGRFVDEEARRRKEGEVGRRNATFERIDSPPEFSRGLSLGRFKTRAQADAALAEFNRIGIRTARVVAYQAATVGFTARVAKADAQQVDRLKALGLPMPFQTCAAPANQ
ncbi:hypothetical protein BH09PSE5_BH09PSE5_40400 [soil metagenome]